MVVQKSLDINGGEFANNNFMTFCEKSNVRICVPVAESPWSNGLIGRLNAVLSIETDLPPVLENKTSSELAQKNMNILHSV